LFWARCSLFGQIIPRFDDPGAPILVAECDYRRVLQAGYKTSGIYRFPNFLRLS
jgi:hypothetical protein